MVMGLCATRILQGCNIRAIVSEVPLMYGTVAVVTGRTNSEEAEIAGGRISEKREKGAMITLISSLLTLFLICETWQFHQSITLKNY